MLYFTFLSIVIHLTMRSGVITLAHFADSQVPRNPFEVTIIEKARDEEIPIEKKYEKPIIKQLDPSPDQIINDNSMARFDSEKTQRVKQETQARNLGLTRNASRRTTAEQNAPQPLERDADLPEFARMNYSSPERSEAQAAAISMVLPRDVQFSDATNLNTDANTYYSFYSRVEELFYVRWAERLNYYWSRLSNDYKREKLSGRLWSTVVEIRLTSTGEYHSSIIHKSSGYKPFDESAVFAFKDARFFPNPPRAKVEADGFVRLKYRFNVHVGTAL